MPVGPPRSDRCEPCRELYKRHNEVERLFRRLKGGRRVYAFVLLALIAEDLR